MTQDEKKTLIISSTSWVNPFGSIAQSPLDPFVLTNNMYVKQSGKKSNGVGLGSAGVNFDKNTAKQNLADLKTADAFISIDGLHRILDRANQIFKDTTLDNTDKARKIQPLQLEFNQQFDTLTETQIENLALKVLYLAAQVMILEKMIEQFSDKTNQQNHFEQQVTAVENLEKTLNILSKRYDKLGDKAAIKNVATNYANLQKMIQAVKQHRYDQSSKTSTLTIMPTAPAQDSQNAVKMPDTITKYLNTYHLSASVQSQNAILEKLLKAPEQARTEQSKALK